MKKTLRVNISGVIFNIDEDAYFELKKYLDTIELHYAEVPEGNEIIDDIEARIAEHLGDKISSEKNVLNIQNIKEIIDIMGMPDEFENVNENNSNTNQPPHSKKGSRRMYRDKDSKYIAGVCSGVGKYFGIDPIIIRALFIISVFFAGTGIIIYLILWIALPEAITASQKLEMKGEQITVTNIEKSLNEEFKNVRENFDKFKESDKYDNLKNKTHALISGIGAFLLTFIKIALILLGVALVISAVSAIFGLTGSLFFSDTIVSLSSEGEYSFDYRAMFEMITDSNLSFIFYIAIILVAVIPLIAVLFIGLKLIFKFKSNNKIILLSALGIWIIGLIMLVFISLQLSKDYKQKSEIKEKTEFNFPTGKTLKLALKNIDINEADEVPVHTDEFIIIEKNKQLLMYIQPNIEIVPASGNNILIKITKKSHGISKKAAFEKAKNIKYNITLQDSILYLGNYFEISEKDKWRNQEVFITIKIPTNEYIYMEDSFKSIHFHAKNTEYFWDYEILERKLIMTDEGMSLPLNPTKAKVQRDTTLSEIEVKKMNEKLKELEEELEEDTETSK